jgi:hypothetical protein
MTRWRTLKKKESKTMESLMNSVELSVRDVEHHLLQTLPTSEVVGQEEGTPTVTSCLSVGDATPSNTPLEFENSLDDLDEESSVGDGAEGCLYLQALFANVSKSEDGGFYLTFQVPDNHRGEVADLLAGGNQVLSLVVVGLKTRHQGPTGSES